MMTMQVAWDVIPSVLGQKAVAYGQLDEVQLEWLTVERVQLVLLVAEVQLGTQQNPEAQVRDDERYGSLELELEKGNGTMMAADALLQGAGYGCGIPVVEQC